MTHAPTPSQTVGPFFAFGLCVRSQHELVDADVPEAVCIAGRVLDGEGEPVPDAMVEIWQADAQGSYGPGFGWARSGTNERGGYGFVTIKPGGVPGADGAIQAPHLNVLVFSRGLLKPVHTRLYFPDEAEANAEDPVLSAVPEALRSSLVAVEEEGSLRFDVRLQGDDQTTFFAV